ncbi:MAG TPA: hypothetical protein VFI33_10630 [Puia sp.]|nr:hypothetical protein [Puia sp.]
MNKMKRNLSRVYLSLVPLWTFILAIAVGHISYKIYLPVWILNMGLMVIAAWILGLHIIKDHNDVNKWLAIGALFLIVPTMLTSMFFGLGPPPETVSEWQKTATEQQIRFIMLVIAAVFVALGFGVLREKLKTTAGNFYSVIGFSAIMVTIPLVILNMIIWGAYLPELFRIMTASGLEKSPEWFHPFREVINLMTPVEIAIMYTGIAAFAIAIRKAGWFSRTPSMIYIVICFVAYVITVIPYSYKLLTIPFIIVTIPASPFTLAYFIGVNLLRKAGDKKIFV